MEEWTTSHFMMLCKVINAELPIVDTINNTIQTQTNNSTLSLNLAIKIWAKCPSHSFVDTS